MPGKARPSLRSKTLANVRRSNLSETDKKCIEEIFERYEQLQKEATMCKHRPTEVELLLREVAVQLTMQNKEQLTGKYHTRRGEALDDMNKLLNGCDVS